MPDADDHDLLTIAEAASLVRAPVATLRYWRHLGTGPRSFRLGRRVVYRRDRPRRHGSTTNTMPRAQGRHDGFAIQLT